MIRKGDKMKLTEQTITHIIIGSGAAGFQAALRLYQNGERDLAIITENIKIRYFQKYRFRQADLL